MSNNVSNDKDFSSNNNNWEFLPPPPPPHSMPQQTQKSVPAPAESYPRQLSNIKLVKFDGKTSAVQ